LAVLGVAAISAFLGWFLIGRHGGKPAEPVDRKAVAQNPEATQEPDAAQRPGGPEEGAAARASGTLQLTSQPDQATVLLDGEDRGLTPMTLEEVAFGTLQIEVRLKGFRTFRQTLELTSEEPELKIHAVLAKESVACPAGTGWIHITSSPAGASIEVDSKPVPRKTPAVIDSVCAGSSHTVQVLLDGYRPHQQELVVNPGEVFNLDIELKHP
jgi:hypothetical protein